MKQVYVGSYQLGSVNVDIYLRDGRGGGEFWFRPEEGCCPRIKISAEGSWYEVLTVLIHEATEAALSIRSCRFSPDEPSMDAASYRFFFDHAQFAAVCDDLAFFLLKAEADIKRAWRAWQRKKARK